ncbi:MAG: phosphoglycerate kinase [Gammaproteobacteria bacterium]|nr:MAG: phosphoglycerate kinase [Gammaproteobacteria bacterium]
MNLYKMSELDLTGKKVLIREDYNVPIKNGVIQSDARLQAALPTAKMALARGAALMLTSHLGRPTEGEYDGSLSLAPIAEWLSDKLGQPVKVVRNYLENGVDVNPGEVVLLENVRFNKGEKKCCDTLSQQMAELCDIYVMDAFGTAHRAQASTYGVAKFAKVACAGPLLVNEINNLEKAVSDAEKPLLAIVGGAKVSSKLALLEQLVDKVDTLIIGGGIANTFLKANGLTIGKSLCEDELIETARRIQTKAEARGTLIPMPVDAGVGKQFDDSEACTIKRIADIADDDMIFDIGPETAEQYAGLIKAAKTIIWNGPVGVFEFPNFIGGTKALADAIAKSEAFSIAGGGDTIAAIQQFGITDDVSYITTGGGAFLEYMEGKKLPAIAILEARFSQKI